MKGTEMPAPVGDINIPPDEFAEGCKLLQAVARNNREDVKRILSANPSRVNFRDYDRRTALHVAASEGHLSLVRYLVDECGARVNRSDRWGGSPLDDARRHRNAEVVAFLRSRGATTGCADRSSNLIAAAAAGDIDEVRIILLSAKMDTAGGVGKANDLDISLGSKIKKVNVDAGDYDHRTALHLAAGEGHADVVELLLAEGADANCEDRWGGHPLDDAKRRNFQNCVKILEKYGAEPGRVTKLNGGRRSSSMSFEEDDNDNLRVDFNELEMIEKVGAGAFGEIYKCRWRGILVAAKCIKATKIQKEWMTQKDRLGSKDESISRRATPEERLKKNKDDTASMDDEEKEMALADFREEIFILRTLRHPNVCMLLAYSITENFEVIVSELMKCSLLDVFKANLLNNTHLSKKKQIVYAQQLAQGMNYLHTCRPPIIHRDLKPANLLIDFSGTLKITDFGLAKVRPAPGELNEDQFLMTGETGSYRFMAPEVFRCEEYTETVDIYSYAMIFYNLLSGKAPWPNLNGAKAASLAALEGQRPIVPRDWDSRLVGLMTRCWHENPQLRPPFNVIVAELSDYLRDVFKTDKDEVTMPDQEIRCNCVIS